MHTPMRAYEVKKIMSRKLVWIMFLICVLCVGIVVFSDLTGKYYVDGKVVDTHYHMFQVGQEYRKALSGRALNQELLEEMSAAYKKIPASAERYTLTEEYQPTHVHTVKFSILSGFGRSREMPRRGIGCRMRRRFMRHGQRYWRKSGRLCGCLI